MDSHLLFVCCQMLAVNKKISQTCQLDSEVTQQDGQHKELEVFPRQLRVMLVAGENVLDRDQPGGVLEHHDGLADRLLKLRAVGVLGGVKHGLVEPQAVIKDAV